MASVTVHCPRCQSTQVYRHDQNLKGRDQFRCRECHRVFLLTYTYEARQHWLWYAYNTKTGGILAYTFGPRTDETCRELLSLFTPFNIGMITSNDWESYAREVPKEKHLTGKIFTQRFERNNLTLRTRVKRLARKTICFSRSIELYEKVIGAFIEKHMFY